MKKVRAFVMYRELSYNKVDIRFPVEGFQEVLLIIKNGFQCLTCQITCIHTAEMGTTLRIRYGRSRTGSIARIFIHYSMVTLTLVGNHPPNWSIGLLQLSFKQFNFFVFIYWNILHPGNPVIFIFIGIGPSMQRGIVCKGSFGPPSGSTGIT